MTHDIHAPTFDNSYARLPERFYSRLAPSPVGTPELIRVNRALAAELGLDTAWLESKEGIRMAAGNFVPEGADPIATAYAGHQFGSWNPQLGDGRALLLGEVVSPTGERFDIQLKGSGRTPYSRGGDGRAPLGPVLREYIVSEAMAAMGIPTSRSLMAVSTGEPVYREGHALPGAVLVRVARSHIRIGTLEFFAARNDTEAVQTLADHVIERHYPQSTEAEKPCLDLFRRITETQASLVAKWQAIGFIHGVMNTDNMLLSGETIDYGPCAFMDHFDPATVFSSIDHGGRYAYKNQPAIAHWNLACLAQALLPLLGANTEESVEDLKQVLDEFPRQFEQAHQAALNRKLGLPEKAEGSRELARDLFSLMTREHSDFTLTFRRLAEMANPGFDPGDGSDFELPESFSPWLEKWQEQLNSNDDVALREGMLQANPLYIPRNHQVEAAIDAAVQDNDFKAFHELVNLLKQPFTPQPGMNRFTLPPTPEQVVPATFCGT